MDQNVNDIQSLMIETPGQLSIFVQWRLAKPMPVENVSDVIYVHGATFPSSLSVFFEFDGRSWSHALNDAGLNVWSFDFAGYGNSERYELDNSIEPRGRASEAASQLHRVIDFVRSRNGRKPVLLLAHSWGCVVALRVAAERADDSIARMVLFGPIANRRESSPAPDLPPIRPINIWEQYRRFTEDVPNDHSPVLLDRHMEIWSKAYLATDPSSQTRTPPSVLVPSGPIFDLVATWNGEWLYAAAKVSRPLLVLRGEWDSLCTDDDVRELFSQIASTAKRDKKLPKGTHLMHLEEGRHLLHDAANRFFRE